MTDLDTLLHEAGSNLTLDRPLPQVVARGTRIRRHRRARVMATVAAVAAVAVVGTTVSLSVAHSDRGITAEAESHGIFALPAHKLAVAERSCRRILAGMTRHGVGFAGPRRLVAAADTLDGPYLLYAGAEQTFSCGLTGTIGGASGSGGTDRLPPHPPGPGREIVNAVNVVHDMWGEGLGSLVDAGLISPEVARVKAQYGGHPVHVATGGGWFFLWAPGHYTRGESIARLVTLTAYDDHGHVLQTISVQDGSVVS